MASIEGSQGSTPARALVRAYFHRYLLAATFIGVVFIVVAAVLRTNGENEILTDVLRDLGIGSLVSVFVVVFIEWRAGLTLRSEIATDVLEAVYRRVVPDVIYTEIRDSIFRSDVWRLDWTLTVTALPPDQQPAISEEMRRKMDSEGMFLVDLETSYKVKNLNDRRVPFAVTGWLDLDVPVREACVPRFTQVTVGDTVWDDELSEVLAQELHAGAEPRTLSDNLRVFVDGNRQIRFKKQVSIPRNGHLHVAYRARCAFRAPGSQVVSTQLPADSIHITTSSVPGLTFDVLPLHPRQGGLKVGGDSANRTWTFKRGILPWQGFQIVSSVVPGAIERS